MRILLAAAVLGTMLPHLSVSIEPHAGVAQRPEKQLVVTITAEQLKGGVVSEITWDNGAIVLQGVFAEPSGQLSAQYFVKAADGIALEHRRAHTEASAKYWEEKSRSTSPTGLGKILIGKDAKMPMYGIGGQAQRMYEATQMGGTQMKHTVRLNGLVLHERYGTVPPYDGEVWSWSPLELNRLAYVDGEGNLWIARADGTHPERILKGDFTLPAWSPDGRSIALAERKNNGRKWEISIVAVPRPFLEPQL